MDSFPRQISVYTHFAVQKKNIVSLNLARHEFSIPFTVMGGFTQTLELQFVAICSSLALAESPLQNLELRYH